MGKARKKDIKNLKKDRTNSPEYKGLMAAVMAAGKFLNTSSSDKDSVRGSFKDAAEKLKVVGVISVEDLEKMFLPRDEDAKITPAEKQQATKKATEVFNAIGTKQPIRLTSDQKRMLIQTGSDNAKAKLLNEYGKRL